MANIKFSAFTTETNSADVDFLVGYQGTTMKKIAPSNLGGSYPFLIDGSGSLYSGFVPSGLSGSPSKNTILGINAGANLTTGYENVYIGYNAGKTGTFANRRIAIGTEAYGNTPTGGGQYSLSIGWDAGYQSSAGEAINIGRFAGYSCSGVEVINIGRDSGRSIIVGPGAATNLGYQCGYSQTSGTRNTNIGYQAAFSNTTNSNRTIIGYQAGQYTTGASNTFVGRYAGRGASGASAGERNTAFGDNALGSIRAGVRNVAVGNGAGQDAQAGDRNTMLGTFAGSNLTSGDYNIIIGNDAQPSSNTVNGEITIGDTNVTSLRLPGLQSGASDGDVLTFSSGTGLITLQSGGGGGASSLNGLSDCLVDTASVYVAEVPAGLSGNPQNNTILGIDAGDALTTGTGNTLIGSQAGLNLTTHFYTTAIGYRAGMNQNAESFNTYIGREAGRDHTGAQSVWIGAQNRVYNNGKNSNGVVAIGYSAHDVSAGNFSTAIGYQTGNAATGDSGTYVGRSAGRVNTSSSHVSIGHNAGYSQTSGTQNTNFGYSAGYSTTTQQSNTMIGYEAGKSNTGSNNVFLGRAAGKGPGNGSQTVAIGQGVMELGAAANNSVFIGNFMAATTTTGANSTVAVGTNCLAIGGYSAEGNTVVGYQAGNNLSSGDNNTCLGKNAGDAITTGTNNIMIGQAAEVSAAGGTNQIVIGQGSTGLGDNTTLLGNSSTATAAIRGNVGIGSDGDATAKLDVFGTDNIMKVRTTTGNGNTPQYLILFQRNSTSIGGNVSMNQYQTFFSTSSDYRLKENVTPITDGISRLKSLKPSRFNFISPLDENGNKLDPNPTVLDGFIAHEAQEIIPECVVGAKDALDENGDPLYQSIDQAKMVPLLTAALKEAVTKIEQLETRIQTLENN